MASKYVFDAFALGAYLEGAAGADTIATILKKSRDRDRRVMVSAIAFGELYRVIRKSSDEETLAGIMAALGTLPLEIVDFDKDQAVAAAELSAQAKIPYSICTSAALAKLRKATLISGDSRIKPLHSLVMIESLQGEQ